MNVDGAIENRNTFTDFAKISVRNSFDKNRVQLTDKKNKILPLDQKKCV